MQKQPSSKTILEYRHYDLPVGLPVIALLEHKFRFPKERFSGTQFLHLHNCIEIGYCYSGGGTLRVENSYTEYGPGDICIVPPFATHISYRDPSTKGQPESLVEYLYFDPELLLADGREDLGFLQLFRHDTQGFPRIIHGGRHPRLAALLLDALDTMRDEEEMYRQKMRGLILAIMVDIARLFPEEARKNAVIPIKNTVMTLAPCMEYINSNYMNRITPQEMAELCHMSLTHFRRVFKAVVGSTPLDYIHRVRIRNSLELLYSSESSILEISLAVGYESISSFNRHFMDIMETTPKKWRNEIRSIPKKDLQHSRFQFT